MLREIWKPLLFRPDNPQIDEVFQTTQRILEWWQKEFFYFFIACTIVGNNRNIMFSPCSPIFSPNGGIYVLFLIFSSKLLTGLLASYDTYYGICFFFFSPPLPSFMLRIYWEITHSIPSSFPLLLLSFSLCLPSYNHRIQNISLFIATFFKVKIITNSLLMYYLSSAQCHIICYLPQFPE